MVTNKIINNNNNNNNVVDNRCFLANLVCILVVKTSDLIISLLQDLAIPLLGLYPKNPETPIQKNLCTPMFIAAQFTIAKCWKQSKCPSVNEWIKKLWYIYMIECYAAERKRSPTLCNGVDGSGEHYAK